MLLFPEFSIPQLPIPELYNPVLVFPELKNPKPEVALFTGLDNANPRIV